MRRFHGERVTSLFFDHVQSWEGVVSSVLKYQNLSSHTYILVYEYIAYLLYSATATTDLRYLILTTYYLMFAYLYDLLELFLSERFLILKLIIELLWHHKMYLISIFLPIYIITQI